MTGPEAVLSCRNASKSFSGVAAVSEVSFSLADGEVLGVIGPNGSGKTTLINCLSGVMPLDEGSVTLDGRDVTGLGSERRSRMGVARTFQTLRLFTGLSVRDNVRIGGHAQGSSSRGWRREAQIRRRAEQTLETLGLAEDAKRAAGTLPYGIQRRVEIARALMSDPRCVLLDEPAAGMNDLEASALRETLEQVRASGVSLLVIEHNTGFIADLVDRAVVLDAGRIIAEGPPGAVLNDDRVLAAYFG